MGILFFTSLGVIQFSGLFALALGRQSRLANSVGSGGALVGALIGLVPAVRLFFTGQIMTVYRPWNIPYGSLSFQIDALSAFFLLPIFLLSAVCAAYGAQYLLPYRETKNLGASWFFFNTLVVSMALVVTARNGILFLMTWEIMSLASYFLVTFEHEKNQVQHAGWIYLTATHLGTACLLALFVLLARESGSMDFDRFEALRFHTDAIAGVAFVLALIGFGTKAGFMPLHVWLPEAHPAAPSHVSALMSGVMIKTGIYGLVRILEFLTFPEAWWGGVLMIIGLTSGILGVLFALAQHDLKRLLAYHSVENIGIIAMGLGLGLFGIATRHPVLACLGFAGGLLHVINHALFKGLLFLGAGAVLHATHTRNMDQLGGLITRMPWTAGAFALGSVAICGLPPLNGFISEFFIYVCSYAALGSPDISGPAGAGIIMGLAMIGTLAVACFTKVFGVVFLGVPRTACAEQAHESGWIMVVSMIILALGCVGVAGAAPWIVSLMNPVIARITGFSAGVVHGHLTIIQQPLESVTRISALLLAGIAGLALIRHRLLARKAVAQSPTWDCGYSQPTARMQYTASSYAQPLTRMFGAFLQTQCQYVAPDGFFPQAQSHLHTHTDDLFTRRIYEPVFRTMVRLLHGLYWMQQGHVQVYVLYIAITLLFLLVWTL